MGVCLTEVKLLAAEAAVRPFYGDLATLGRQHVYATEADVRRIFTDYRLPLGLKSFTLHRDASLAAQGFISDESLFLAFGFERVTRIDIDEYELADAIVDLNSSETPAHLVASFDTVMDFGTLEHVFHVPHAMAHLSRLLRPCGRIVHMLPASNCVEHGFYSFSPTFIRDYYAASGFDITTIYLCQLPRKFERSAWTLYEYPVDHLNAIPMGRLGSGIFAIFAIVSATERMKIGVIPQQGFYREVWSRERSAVTAPPEGKAEKLVSLLDRSPTSRNVAQRVVANWRAWRRWWREMREGKVPLKRVGRL